MFDIGSSIIFLVVTYPLVTYYFRYHGKGEGTSNRTVLLTALGVLAVALALKLGYDMHGDAASYYKALEVGRHSSPIDIRKAYKQISRTLHPDKNPSPTAETDFQRVKAAYDVLMDEKLRDVYNRFGAEALTFDPRHDELKLLSTISSTYIFWLVIIFVTTVPSGSRASRTWAAIVGIAILVLEVCLCLTETSIPLWFPKHVTEAELVVFLHRVFPGLLVALRCISETFYVDIDDVSLQFLQEMELQHTCMSNLLQQLKTSMTLHDSNNAAGCSSSSSCSSGSGGSSSSSNSISKGGVVSEKVKTNEALAVKLDDLMTILDESSTKRSKLVEMLDKSVSDPAAGYYWLVLVIMYGALYLSSSGVEEGGGKS